jgi:hypothetical protein
MKISLLAQKLQALLVSLVFCFCIGRVAAEEVTWRPGVLVVQWQDGETFQSMEGEIVHRMALPVGSMEPIFSQTNLYLIHLPDQGRETFWKERLQSLEGVLWVSYDYPVELRSQPNDPFYSEQYYLDKIRASEVWRLSTGGVTALGDTLVVAIHDSGFRLDHPDLQPNWFYNRGELPGDGIDNDENGYVDDFLGYNAASQNDGHAHSAHGTSVAGIVGARGNNGLGITGLNWKVKLLPISGITWASDVIKGYAYVYEQRKAYNDSQGQRGAFVVASNSSFGLKDSFPTDNPLFQAWCDMYDAMGSVGILSVGSTSNENKNVGLTGDIPSTCSSPFLIVVTGSGEFDDLGTSPTAFGSQFVHLAAPAERLYTTSSSSANQMPGYGLFGGTSGAAPQVASGIALLSALPYEDWAHKAKFSPSEYALEMKNHLLSSVDKLEVFKDRVSTGGRLNLGRAEKMISDSYGLSFGNTFEFKSLYPNPCCPEGSKLFFTFENLDLQDNLLQIYSLSGQLLHEQIYRPLDFFGEIPYVDLSRTQVPIGGAYILVMRRNKRIASKIFLRLR